MKQRAIKELEKVLKEQYTEKEIETFEWFVDQETAETYSWCFRFPEDGFIRSFVYHKKLKKVVIWKREGALQK